MQVPNPSYSVIGADNCTPTDATEWGAEATDQGTCAPSDSTMWDGNPDCYIHSDSLTALLALGVPGCTRAKTLGFTTLNDGGGGEWWYDPDSTATVDNVEFAIPDDHSGAGRWTRIMPTHLTPQMGGAIADATWTGTDWTGTDNTAAIQAVEDVCEKHGLEMVWTGGDYYVVGTIIKRRYVNWRGPARGLWQVQAGDGVWLGGANLCPSHGTPSVRDLISNQWSNAVVEVSVENTGLYFIDCKIENVNVYGTPNGAQYNDPTLQCPRVAFAVNKMTEFSIDLTVIGMRSAVAGNGWQDSYCEGTYQTCGYDAVDDADAAYMFDLRNDPRVTTWSPGYDPSYTEYAEFSGSNALHFSNSRWIVCWLWAYLEGWEGAGGIKFQGVKMEDKDHKMLPDGTLLRNHSAFEIEGHMGDVYFGAGCQFRSQQDLGDKFLFQIANKRTVFDGCAFLGLGRWINAVANGIVISNFTTQVCRNDVTIFNLPTNAIMSNGFVEQELRTEAEGCKIVPAQPDKRYFALLYGGNTKIDSIVFNARVPSEGITTPVSAGALFQVQAEVDESMPDNIAIDFSVENPDEFHLAAFPVGVTDEGNTSWENILVDRWGAHERTWTDTDWASGGELYTSAGITIKQKRKCIEKHTLNPQTANATFFAIIQGTIGERIQIQRDPSANTYGVTFMASTKMRLKDVADNANIVMGTDFDWIIMECQQGDVWVEIQRGKYWSL